jgi:hypothetical protein
MRQEKGFKFYLDTKNNGALPLDPACLECLSVRSSADLSYTGPKLCAGEAQRCGVIRENGEASSTFVLLQLGLLACLKTSILGAPLAFLLDGGGLFPKESTYFS